MWPFQASVCVWVLVAASFESLVRVSEFNDKGFGSNMSELSTSASSSDEAANKESSKFVRRLQRKSVLPFLLDHLVVGLTISLSGIAMYRVWWRITSPVHDKVHGKPLVTLTVDAIPRLILLLAMYLMLKMCQRARGQCMVHEFSARARVKRKNKEESRRRRRRPLVDYTPAIDDIP